MIIRNISRVDQAVCWPDFTAPYSTKLSTELSSRFRLTLSCCSTTLTVDEVQWYARYTIKLVIYALVHVMLLSYLLWPGPQKHCHFQLHTMNSSAHLQQLWLTYCTCDCAGSVLIVWSEVLSHYLCMGALVMWLPCRLLTCRCCTAISRCSDEVSVCIVGTAGVVCT